MNKRNFVFHDKLTTLINEDTFSCMKAMRSHYFNLIVADPPYFLSNNGFSNSGGKKVSVNKGNWDKTTNRVKFYNEFIKECLRLLTNNGTLWTFGNMHNIYLLGYLIQKNGMKILNNITWQKSNPAPNLSCRMFTHSTENIIWAKKNHGKQLFNYKIMKQLNHNKQMKDVWTTPTIQRSEKRFGNHPTQKPLSVIMRIIEASANKRSKVLDPFVGSGTTCIACRKLGIKSIGIDNSNKYLRIAKKRTLNYKTEKVGHIK